MRKSLEIDPATWEFMEDPGKLKLLAVRPRDLGLEFSLVFGV